MIGLNSLTIILSGCCCGRLPFVLAPANAGPTVQFVDAPDFTGPGCSLASEGATPTAGLPVAMFACVSTEDSSTTPLPYAQQWLAVNTSGAADATVTVHPVDATGSPLTSLCLSLGPRYVRTVLGHAEVQSSRSCCDFTIAPTSIRVREP